MRPHISYPRRILSRAQAAEVLAQHVRQIGGIHAAASLLADLICGQGSGERTLSRLIKAAMDRRDCAIYAPLVSHADCFPDGGPADVRAYLLGIASPSANTEALGCVVVNLLRDRLDAHAVALNDLRGTHPALFNALFAPTLDQAVALGRRAGLDRARLHRLFADRTRFILVGIAHDRIAYIRRIATSPFGNHFCGLRHWKSAGHVLLTTVCEPALVVDEVYKCAATFKGTDEAARKKLFGRKLLPDNDDGALVFALGLETRALIIRREASLDNVQAMVDRTLGPLASVAQITREDVAREGLFNSSISNLWFGLEPSELAVYVAIELLKALDAVDALVEAALDGRKISPAGKMPSDAKVAYATAILRCEGRSDRESLQIGRGRGKDGGLDPANHGSRGPLATMKKKIGDPEITGAVARTFGIDPSRLFRR